MNVLSLFDGVSCGMLALLRGVHVGDYFSYEIDKDAIKVSEKHFPDIIRCGDVTAADFTQYRGIDLLIGGSPCQGFSFAGKQLNFNDTRSRLFFEYARALKEARPKYFLLENVPMAKDIQDAISEIIGVQPVKIDSQYFSAQQRKRLYWTNIPIAEYEDKGIMLEDVVEPDALVDRDKAHAIIGSIGRTTHREYFKKNQGQIVYKAIELSNIYGGFKEKCPRVHINKSVTIRTAGGGGTIPSLIINDKAHEFTLEEMKKCIRKVTPLECERLQTMPDGFTDVGISNTARYKLIGNAWTVDVISHILKGMIFDEKTN